MSIGALRSRPAIELCLVRSDDAVSDPDRAKAWFEGAGAVVLGGDLGSRQEVWRNVSDTWGDASAPFPRFAVSLETGTPRVTLLTYPVGTGHSPAIIDARK